MKNYLQNLEGIKFPEVVDYSRRDAQNDFLREVVYALLNLDVGRAVSYLTSKEHRYMVASTTSGLSDALQDMNEGYISETPQELVSRSIEHAKLLR